MKKKLFAIGMMLIILLIGCSKDSTDDPSNQLNTYIKEWKESNFETMYNMLTDDTKEKYNEEAFIDRYEKIYHDLKIKDISIK